MPMAAASGRNMAEQEAGGTDAALETEIGTLQAEVSELSERVEGEKKR